MYSPQNKEQLIKALYQLKQKELKPITVLANEAITEYLIKKEMMGEEPNVYRK